MLFQIHVHPARKGLQFRVQAIERFVDRGRQFIFVNRFDEDIPGTGLHRTNGCLGGVGVDQDDDVGARGFLPDGPQNFQTVKIRQVDVQDGNIYIRGTDELERFATEPGCLYTPRLRRQPDDVPQPPANPAVAIRDEESDAPARFSRRWNLVGCD